MTVIAAIEADLEVTPLGTRSRLGDDLCGERVLRRTVNRLARAQRLDAIFVLCPAEQVQTCTKLLSGTKAIVKPHDAGPPPWRGLVQPARKWSLDGWRGGIGGTTVFDEYTDCRLLHELLNANDAEAVLSVPPGAALFDPVLANRMIEHHSSVKEEARMVFTQAPPGVTGLLLDRALVKELADQRIPVGWLLSYKPDAPQKDLIFSACCVDIPVELRHSVGRLIADTDSAARRIVELLNDHEDPDAATIGRWLIDRERAFVPRLPHEVEIELTTDDPYPSSLLHPRGKKATDRSEIDVSIVKLLAEELTTTDDSLVVLGGFGDPLRHPNLRGILEVLRPQGHEHGDALKKRSLYGLALRTWGVDLTDEQINLLLEFGVDVLEVILDAWTPETYPRLCGNGDGRSPDLNQVLANLDRFTQRREQARLTRPILLPSLTKSKENVHELDAFFDGWLRRAGAVAIHGYSDYAGQREDRSVISMTPPSRIPCRRLWSRCMVLADGSVTMCDQDICGRAILGRIGEQSLEEIWNGESWNRLRANHHSLQLNQQPLCSNCSEWHRQ